MSDAERLSKLLARAGIGSRRAVDALIAAGRVRVDGRPAVLGERVDPSRVVVTVDGRRVELVAPPPVYLAVHKPAGVTSTVRDRFARRTIIDLLPAELRTGRHLFPVGRLDRDSEGLVLVTNDGAWAERVLHPRFGVEREYAIALDRRLDRLEIERLRLGIPLAEGTARVLRLRPAMAAEIRRLVRVLGLRRADEGQFVWYRVVLATGWKRQLRRMVAALGLPVRRLVRVRIGGVELGDLPPGAVRVLTPAEVAGLVASAAASPSTRSDSARRRPPGAPPGA